MNEYILLATIGLLACLMGFLGTYLALRKVKNDGLIVDIFEDFSEEVLQNTDMQKKIYVLGALLGQGVRQGIGFPKSSGKFKMENIIGMAISKFLGFQGETPQVQTPTAQIPKIPEHLKG